MTEKALPRYDARILADLTETLTLLSPLALSGSYAKPRPERSMHRALEAFSSAFDQSPAGTAGTLSLLQAELESVPTRALPPDFETGTALKRSAALELDRYMRVRHVDSDSPGAVLLASLISACRAFYTLAPRSSLDSSDLERIAQGISTQLALLARTVDEPSVETQILLPERALAREIASDELLEIWRRGHWIFFVLTQGLTMALQRFAGALGHADLGSARVELRAATALLWASGASMKLAGTFSNAQYHASVRPSMTLGDPAALVEHTSLSGTMTWDHHFLVSRVWREALLPLVGSLSGELRTDYEAFVTAYRGGLASGHRAVCSKFGGEAMGSLVAPHQIATEILDRIETRRLAQLTASEAAED